MLVAIFKKYDKDGDNMLKFSEIKELQFDTEGLELSKKEYKRTCGLLGVNHTKGLSLQHLAQTYTGKEGSLETDYAKVFEADQTTEAVSGA